MDEQLTISTPEQVAFHYEMAGIGSRFVASLLDHLIIVTALFLINCAIYGIFLGGLLSGITSGETGEVAAYLIIALLVIITFAIFWGYFVLFETVWNGQTPGKRGQRLRVIRRDGQPVRAGEVMIRNLVRLVDLLPGFYGIGLVTMFIDKDARRLGDFAAGTIVVREGEVTQLADVQIRAGATSPVDYSAPPVTPSQGQSAYFEGGYAGPPLAEDAQSYAPQSPPVQRYDPLPGVSLRDLTNDDYRLIREMLARWSRGEIARERANELSYRLAHGVASRMGQDFDEWQHRGWQPITFLQSVLTAKEARQ